MEKSADVRLLDVFVLGPFMIWFGLTARGVSPLARSAMVVAGIGTIVYNAGTYTVSLEE